MTNYKCPFTVLAEYRDILGKPNEGVHAKRIGPFALNDFIGTIIGAIILSYIINTTFIKAFIFLFILGEVLHYIFCVDTAFLRILFTKIKL